MSPSRAVTRGAVLVLLAGTAACGVKAAAPKVELRDALVAFAEARSASFTVSLPSSPDDVRDFVVATGEDDSSVDDAMLEQLLATELVAAYDHGENRKDTADDAGRLQLRFDGADHVEMRVVDEVVYLRVDVPGLSDRFPEMTEGVEEFRAQLEADDLGALEPAADAALAGDWVSIDTGEGSWPAEQQKSAAGESMQLPGDFGQRVLDVAGRALKETVSVRRVDDRLIATANTRDLYTSVSAELPELLGEIAPGARESLPPAGEVPSRDVSVSFWVEDGELRRAELDLAQFLDEPAGHFVIRVDTAEGKTIEAPDGAVEFDMEEFAAQTGVTPGQMFGGLVGPGGPAGEPGAEPGVEAAALAVSAEFQAYAAMDGVAPSIEYLPLVAEAFAGPPPVELHAVGDRVQVAYNGEVACLTLPADTDHMTAGTVVVGPC